MRAAAPRLYRIARRPLQTETAPELLAQFEAHRAAHAAVEAVHRHGAGAQVLFHGLGWVARSERPVVCSLDAGRYQIDVDGVGLFSVTADGSSFTCLETHPQTTPHLVAEAAVGPPLVLALALQGAFCLHASAVTDGRTTVAFVGASGAGKSTLARLLHQDEGLPWKRVADDVLPAELEGDRLLALPRFPQLKLEPAAQPWIGLPEALPLDAVCVLEQPEERDEPSTGVAVRELSPRDAALALLGRTVAARLFSPELHARHLELCARAAERVRICRLSYPWGIDHIPAVSHALLEATTGAT